ncbi:Uncharacterised protein [Achromobacter sp. 2789STDY5608615]|uniref:hypothetical protein n=1 Tax=Achromobacter sp. 2789STDY5608615 TaxID=1806492 RepID=UPI0006C26322|nr:hypothetical protein [Achromobacter sp. 2789STDY5608615]CUJ97992.1 Uncharacterised protein [Achromobacter sp. 2789STDY5608615]
MPNPQSRLLALAAEAKQQYLAECAAGGEPAYPAWIEDALAVCGGGQYDTAAPGVSTVEDERQAFEAWAEDQGFVLDCDFFEVSGQYYDQDDTQLAYDIWRAARASVAAPAAGDALEVDPLQGAANWLVQAHSQPCPIVLSACLMIGYNRAQRLYDAAIAAQRKGGA